MRRLQKKNKRALRLFPRAAEKSDVGVAIVELSLVIGLVLSALVLALESLQYSKTRENLAMLGKNAAIRAYKQCRQVADAELNDCLTSVKDFVEGSLDGSYGDYNLVVSLYRCTQDCSACDPNIDNSCNCFCVSPLSGGQSLIEAGQAGSQYSSADIASSPNLNELINEFGLLVIAEPSIHSLDFMGLLPKWFFFSDSEGSLYEPVIL